ncbi:MAG: Flp family type IVb pilin [Roseiarcus sp.]|jgi:Flp pilus assembly pilin Flp
MIKFIKSFVADETGSAAIEYALVASLIAIFTIGSLAALGTKLSVEFTEVDANME